MTIYLIIFAALILIIGGLMFILKSATKFKLTDEQLTAIKQREQAQQEKDERD